MKAFLSAISVFGPGLPGWEASQAMLAGSAPWVMAEVLPPAPAILAPGDRRRAGATTRFALAAAAEATGAEPDRAIFETVFASGNGDGAVIGTILDAMHTVDGVVSPTLFHNSVHNAAAGYWHIAVGSTMPSVSLGGHDGAFAAGLLAAMGAVVTRGRPVLLVAYDTPMAAPLSGVRPTAFPFATACLLRPTAEGAQALLALRHIAEAAPEPPPGDALDALAAGNPAARALPLLRALAARRAATLTLPLLADAHLELRVTPC
jgi:hypothetical protein